MIACYVEGFRDARRIVIGQRALSRQAFLMWKVGDSEAGASAAASHTANLGGAPVLYRSAFAQAGIIEVRDVSDLADSVMRWKPAWWAIAFHAATASPW